MKITQPCKFDVSFCQFKKICGELKKISKQKKIFLEDLKKVQRTRKYNAWKKSVFSCQATKYRIYVHIKFC